MDKIKMDSSLIESVGYDPSGKLLEVTFRPKQDGEATTYHYKEFPQTQFLALLSAQSKGSWFGKHIRGKYKGEKV